MKDKEDNNMGIDQNIWQVIGLKYKSHPWHGVSIGENAPNEVNVFVEIVPSDTIKYEIDKKSGYLKIDRPQKFSNICPSLYGFVPQTYCGEKVAEYTAQKTGRVEIIGDGDPLDICVLTEKNIPRGDLLLQAVPIGGFRMIDNGEADDKIIAVLKGDLAYGNFKELKDCPPVIIDRLKHYFLTYKNVPGDNENRHCEITHVYGRKEAREVIERSSQDYLKRFSHLNEMLIEAILK